jgi:hypothetical protein
MEKYFIFIVKAIKIIGFYFIYHHFLFKKFFFFCHYNKKRTLLNSSKLIIHYFFLNQSILYRNFFNKLKIFASLLNIIFIKSK